MRNSLSASTLALALLAVAAQAGAVPGQQDESPAVAGDWTGDSICQVKASACHDEKALYRVKVAEGKPGMLEIAGFKIVNDKPVLMGTLACQYDRGKQTITCDYAQGELLLRVSGDTMQGTLTTPDKVVFRRISLKKAG